MTYICTSCGFRVESRKAKCPYCDKANMEEEKSAEQLLDEISIE